MLSRRAWGRSTPTTGTRSAPTARSLGDAIAAADLADPGLAAVFAPGGHRLTTGDVLQQPALAATLCTLATDGARVFYEGPIAAALAAVGASR
jgi:gamma-glutamyltranspeptidase